MKANKFQLSLVATPQLIRYLRTTPVRRANNGSRVVQFRQFRPLVRSQVDRQRLEALRALTSFGRDRITCDVTAKIASSRDENWRNRDKRVSSLVRMKSIKA